MLCVFTVSDMAERETGWRIEACINSTLRMNPVSMGLYLYPDCYFTSLLLPCISQVMPERKVTWPLESGFTCLLICLVASFAWRQGISFVRLAYYIVQEEFLIFFASICPVLES